MISILGWVILLHLIPFGTSLALNISWKTCKTERVNGKGLMRKFVCSCCLIWHCQEIANSYQDMIIDGNKNMTIHRRSNLSCLTYVVLVYYLLSPYDMFIMRWTSLVGIGKMGQLNIDWLLIGEGLTRLYDTIYNYELYESYTLFFNAWKDGWKVIKCSCYAISETELCKMNNVLIGNGKWGLLARSVYVVHG